MHKAELTALAEQVCRHLPGKWSVVPCDHEHVAKIGNGNGQALSLNASWAGPGRISISGEYPRSKENQCYGRWAVRHDEPLPKISVADNKTAKQIAGDIARRLLTDYQAVYDKAIAIKRQHDQADDQQRVTLARLGAIPGVRINLERGTFDIGHDLDGYIREGRVCGSSVSMNLYSLSTGKAEAVLKLLADGGPNHA